MRAILVMPRSCRSAAQAHRAVEQYDIAGEVVLIVDDDLVAALEV
jgi:hypothetical protein